MFLKPLESNASHIGRTQCPCEWFMILVLHSGGQLKLTLRDVPCLEQQRSDNNVEAALLGCSSSTSAAVIP